MTNFVCKVINKVVFFVTTIVLSLRCLKINFHIYIFNGLLVRESTFEKVGYLILTIFSICNLIIYFIVQNFKILIMRILFVILLMSTFCLGQSKKELEVKVTELNNSIAELQTKIRI